MLRFACSASVVAALVSASVGTSIAPFAQESEGPEAVAALTTFPGYYTLAEPTYTTVAAAQMVVAFVDTFELTGRAEPPAGRDSVRYQAYVPSLAGVTEVGPAAVVWRLEAGGRSATLWRKSPWVRVVLRRAGRGLRGQV